MSNFAFVVNQSTKLQNILLNENETGNQNKPPKLMSLDDYPQWKSHFEIYINGVDTAPWEWIEVGYDRPMRDTGRAMLATRMSEAQHAE